MSTRFPECEDCAFHGVEPAICDECEEADQFEQLDENSSTSVPIYFRDWRKAA